VEEEAGDSTELVGKAVEPGGNNLNLTGTRVSKAEARFEREVNYRKAQVVEGNNHLIEESTWKISVVLSNLEITTV
jgi:hypothetical protein